MMKKFFTIIIAILLAATVWAQSPQKMSYQAVIRDGSGNLVTSHLVGMRISILKDATPVYVEIQTITSNANGLVSIEIGSVTPVTGTFASIDWSAGSYSIKTETDPTGGTNYSAIVGTSQLLSVPFALHTKTAESLTGTITETDPIFVAWDKTSGINIQASQVSDFQTSVNNNAAVLANTAKKSYPSADSTKLATLATIATTGSYTDLTNKPVGTNPGDMQYWNGAAWVNVPAGQAGQFLQFSASNIPTWSNSTPTLTTSAVSSITSTSATCGGNITSEGVAPVSDRGVCWSTSTSPTIANSKTTNGTGSGSYTSSITGLSLGTTYYVRAYATSIIGTTYGNELCFIALAIGDTYQGGIVAYILQAGDPGYSATVPHGLIAAPSDQSNASWGCYGTDIAGAEGTAIGTGNQNTLDIIAGCPTAGIAAKECADLVLGGYSDWYLPSKDELNKLFINKVAIGGFTNNKYWSSSEAGSNYAWVQNMGTGYQGYDGKNADPTYYYVRAVRAF